MCRRILLSGSFTNGSTYTANRPQSADLRFRVMRERSVNQDITIIEFDDCTTHARSTTNNDAEYLTVASRLTRVSCKCADVRPRGLTCEQLCMNFHRINPRCIKQSRRPRAIREKQDRATELRDPPPICHLEKIGWNRFSANLTSLK